MDIEQPRQSTELRAALGRVSPDISADLKTYFGKVKAIADWVVSEGSKAGLTDYNFRPNPFFDVIPNDGSLVMRVKGSVMSFATPLGQIRFTGGEVGGEALSELLKNMSERLSLQDITPGENLPQYDAERFGRLYQVGKGLDETPFAEVQEPDSAGVKYMMIVAKSQLAFAENQIDAFFELWDQVKPE